MFSSVSQISFKNESMLFFFNLVFCLFDEFSELAVFFLSPFGHFVKFGLFFQMR